MIVRMLYVLPMLLGRTYDVRTNSVGVDIFPKQDTDNPRVIEESFYRSSYKTVESSSDVKDVLEISGELSLSIKAGSLAVSGLGAYVKSAASAQDAVDILIKVSFRTVSRSLPHSARPLASWLFVRPEYLGTHFVQSVLYGGDLIARVRFRAARKEDLQQIRATVTASLSGGSALDLLGEGRLESLDRALSKRASMEIDYFATVPLEGVPNTVSGLRALVRRFEEHVKKVNDGLGVPVEVELRELASFDRKFEYVKNLELETELEFFEEYLDDLLSTKSRLKSLIYEFPNELDNTLLKKLSQLSERTGAVLRQFFAAIADLDLSKGSSQLDAAKAAYYEGKGLGMAGKFRRELNKMLHKVNSSLESGDARSSVYTRFGADDCPRDAILLFSGHAATSPRNQIGSGRDLLCMPLRVPEGQQGQEGDGGPKVSGVRYGLLSPAPPAARKEAAMGGVLCAVCLLRRTQTVFVFHGASECPPGGWRVLHTGHLMVAAAGGRSEGACVDARMEAQEGGGSGRNEQTIEFAGAGKFVPCTVCAK